MKYTGVIILNYNNWEDTLNCIDSVEKYNTAPIKIIVVDNGSNRDAARIRLKDSLYNRFGERLRIYKDDRIESYQPLSYISLIQSNYNDGYAKGNNKGVYLANTDDEISKLLILNNDILFVEDIIPAMLNFIDNNKDCAIVSPLLFTKDMEDIDHNCARYNYSNWSIILNCLLLYKDVFGIITKSFNKVFLLKKYPDLINNDYFEIELPSGSCMLVDKFLFNKLGAFDPNTFLYFEENILFKKISKINRKNYMIPKLRCIHLGAKSTKQSSSSLILRYGLDSKDYYLKTYGELRIIERVVWSVAKNMFLFKIKLVNKLKG